MTHHAEPKGRDFTPYLILKISFPRSHKVSKLRRLLDLNSRHEAMGVIVDMFVHTWINAWRTGDLSRWTPEDLEEWVGWGGKTGALVKALQECGIMDGMAIHEWPEHQRRSIRERARAHVKGFSRPEEDPEHLANRTKEILANEGK